MRTALVLLIVMAAVSAAPAAEAPGEKLILAGDSRTLWLVRSNKERSAFAVVARPAGKKWRWIARQLVGAPTMAAVSDGQVHVLFDSGAQRIFRMGSSESVPGSRVAAMSLAICAATDFGSIPGASLLAVAAEKAPRPAAETARATQPTSRSHSRPAGAGGQSTDSIQPAHSVRLVVRQKTPTEWREVADMLHQPAGPGGRGFLAALGQTVFLALAGGDGPNRLWALEGRAWREISLPDRLARLDLLALLTVEDRLVLALMDREADGRGRQVHLAMTDATAGELSVRSVRKDKVVRSWPAGTDLHVARPGNELALLWKEDSRIRLGSCDLTGKFMPMADVTVFDKLPSEGRGQRLHQQVQWAVMLLVFALVFRPRNRAVFVLPPGLHPAPMPRRILAVLVDTAPFGMLSAGFFASDLRTTVVDWHEVRASNIVPDAVLYWQLLAVGLYTVYATVMEARRGATIGKTILQMRVVDGEGKPPRLWAVILRNVARMIPLLWGQLLFLLLLFSIFNAARQRLGDVLARTCVIDARFVPPPLPADEPGDDSSDEPPETPS